jgi:Tfp pilus assembly protein PilF
MSFGDIQGAMSDFNKAIDIDPNSAASYINRGTLKQDLGDMEGACLDWSKAGELGESFAYEIINNFCN